MDFLHWQDQLQLQKANSHIHFCVFASVAMQWLYLRWCWAEKLRTKKVFVNVSLRVFNKGSRRLIFRSPDTQCLLLFHPTFIICTNSHFSGHTVSCQSPILIEALLRLDIASTIIIMHDRNMFIGQPLVLFQHS